MILSDRDIRKALENGSIQITPLREDCFKHSSYMLTASNTAYIIDNSAEYIDMRERTYPYIEITIPEEGYLIQPGEFLNIKTTEHVTLDHNTSAFFSTRGRVAQAGLNVLLSSLYIEPGSDNHMILECQNVGPIPLKLFPGIPLVKCVFMQTLSETEQKGKDDSFYKRHQSM